MDRLKQIMDKLRERCPWDKEQTHQSLRTYIVEEVYEVIDAIDKKDDNALIEELGDLLLQIVFHCKIAEEQRRFTLNDVISRVSKKLIRRHPHVFGDKRLNDQAEVLKQWENIKINEGKKNIFEGIPRHLPALIMSYRVISKLRRVNKNIKFKNQKFVSLVKKDIRNLKKDKLEKYIGELLFDIASISQMYGIDPEVSLLNKNRMVLHHYEK
ncbi:MAG: nucleoside triphosphate pyrophosphohydrolase [Candidatus Hydrogenedentota bacterium]